MPNSLTAQVSHDGPRNAVVDIIGVIEEDDLPPTRVVDIACLYAEPNYKITRVRVDTIDYFVDKDISVELLWEAQPPKHILMMNGKGQSNREASGGRQNVGETATGNIMVSTSGWRKPVNGEPGRRTFSIQLELVKQFT